MNQNIKYLIEKEYVSFNPNVLSKNNRSKQIMGKHAVEDVLYYNPSDKQELISIIQFLLSEGITDLNCINVAYITDMSDLFNQQDWRIHKKNCVGLTKRQQSQIDISEWDVSNVKDFRAMFYQCDQFNGDITNWNVSSGNCFHHMFSGCKSFNQDIGNWDVSSGTDFFYMFTTCKSFNQDLSKWNINSDADYHKMFNNCKIENRYKPILLQK